MQLYIAYHNKEWEDSWKDRSKSRLFIPTHKEIIIEDDLEHPLHSEIIKELLCITHFGIAPFYKESCMECDLLNNGCKVEQLKLPLQPTGNMYSEDFILKTLKLLIDKHKEVKEYSDAINDFYLERIKIEFDEKRTQNANDYYYIIVDPERHELVEKERYVNHRREEIVNLYNKYESPACYFDKTILYLIYSLKKDAENIEKLEEVDRELYENQKGILWSNSGFHYHMLNDVINIIKGRNSKEKYIWHVCDMNTAIEFFRTQNIINRFKEIEEEGKRRTTSEKKL